MPGSTENEVKPALEAASGKQLGADFGLCYSPQFVALGSVIRDFLQAEFRLIGESDPVAGEALAALYERVREGDTPSIRTNFINAEIAKIAINTFVTTKITFANMLARICERSPGSDIDAIAGVLAHDGRIGRKCLKGATAYGGPCFPRDNLALSAYAESIGVSARLAEATDRSNREEITLLADLVAAKLPAAGKVAVLGLAYKPDTDVVEESPGFLLAGLLATRGIAVSAYDPQANQNAERVLSKRVVFAASASDCVAQADVVVIATAWDEFRRMEPAQFSRNGSRCRVIIDCWRLFDARRFDRSIEYVALGRSQR